MAGFRSVGAVGKSIEALSTTPSPTAPGGGLHHHRPPGAQRRPRPARATTTLMFPALSILLYRVDFNKTMRASWSSLGSVDGFSHLPLDLHFLLTAWADNAEHEHQIIGRAMQVFEAVGALSGPPLTPTGEWEAGEAVQLYLEDMAPTTSCAPSTAAVRLPAERPYIARVVVVADRPGRADGSARSPAGTVVSGSRGGTRLTVNQFLPAAYIETSGAWPPGSSRSRPWAGARRCRASGSRSSGPRAVSGAGRRGAVGNYDVGIGLPAVARNGAGRFAITYSLPGLLAGRGTPVRPGDATSRGASAFRCRPRRVVAAEQAPDSPRGRRSRAGCSARCCSRARTRARRPAPPSSAAGWSALTAARPAGRASPPPTPTTATPSAGRTATTGASSCSS